MAAKISGSRPAVLLESLKSSRVECRRRAVFAARLTAFSTPPREKHSHGHVSLRTNPPNPLGFTTVVPQFPPRLPRTQFAAVAVARCMYIP